MNRIARPLIAAIAALVSSVAATAGATAQDGENDAAGLKGSEHGMEFRVDGFERARAFERYLVLTNSSPDGVGEVITVYRNDGSDTVDALAAGRTVEPYETLELPETF